MADALAVLENDRVHRPESAGIVGQISQQRNDFLLAGVSNIETGETHALGGDQQLGKRFHVDIELLQIN